MNTTFKRLGAVATIAVAGSLVLSSCAANEEAPAGGDSDSSLSGTINGVGASSMGSAQEAWIAAFQGENTGVTINYDPAGSGAGREAFIAGGALFAGSDSALSDEEIAGGFAGCATEGYIQAPAYISPIAVIFNVEGVDELNLDAVTLANIFNGSITQWNDPAIAALNADAELPAAPITAVHRSDDSGTTKNFADYLNKVAPEAWSAEPSDTFPFQSGEGAQGTSGVVEAVTTGTNTIGYADASRAGDLGVAAIKVGEEFVAYTAEAAAAVVDGSPAVEGRDETDLAIKLDRNTTDPTQYPLVLVSYVIACQEYEDASDAANVKAYLTYITSEEGQSEAATEAGAAPLSTELSGKVAAALATIK